MIWVGTCHWDLKNRPIFYQILPKHETHFFTRATNFKQNLQKISHYFPKLLSFQANFRNLVSDWWNWAYFRANFRKFLKYDPCLYQFLHWILRSHRYTRRLILRPISAAHPRINLFTKKPPGQNAQARGGGGVLSGKVGTGMCSLDRVLFRALRFCNGPFFIWKLV